MVRRFTDVMVEVLREQDTKEVTRAAMRLLVDIKAVLANVLHIAQNFESSNKFLKARSASSSAVRSFKLPLPA